MMDDRELVAAVLHQDRKATAEFVAAHTGFLYSYVRRQLCPRAPDAYGRSCPKRIASH